VEGVWRFLNRVWRLAQGFISTDEAKILKRSLDDSIKTISKDDLERLVHVTINRVTKDIRDDFGFNTAISAVMELVNGLYLYPELGDALSKSAVETILHLLNPYAPHMTEELWEAFGHKTMLVEEPWPHADTKKMTASVVQVVVQVNGKVREKIAVAAGSSEEAVKASALEALTKRGMKVDAKRIIYVPQKLVNFVA
jgi:leucyl-tRNA synthetase